MEKAEILKSLIKKKGYNVREFSAVCGIPYSTLLTILKNGVSRASVDNVIKICKGLEIRVDDLEAMAESRPVSVSYCLDDDVLELAQEISENDTLRALVMECKKLPGEKLAALLTVVKGIE